MTKEELHILQHSLGVDQYGQGTNYRNHFVAGAGGPDDVRCRILVSHGYMSLGRKDDLSGGEQTYHVTPAGIVAMHRESAKPPKLSRGQQRYRDWIDRTSEFETFGEYLKAQKRRREAT